MANDAMRAAWDGDEGEHWAANADWYDRASVRVTAGLTDAIGVGADDAVLDVGCGAGGLTLELAQTCASAHGVDLSSQMLDVANKRAADRGLSNATFEQADAQTTAFDPAAFDVAVSSFGVMFFDDLVAAFTNIGAALKPDGRLVLAVWRDLRENEWLMQIRDALALGRDLPFPPLEAPTPFALSNQERTTSILTSAGFGDIAFQPMDEPMVAGVDAADAFEHASKIGLVKGLTDDLTPEQKAEGLGNLHALMLERVTPAGVLLPTAAWIISARKAA